MTAPHDTPNVATITRPERSSKKVDRKSPLGWLPWALLGALAALLALVLLLVNAVDDDGPEGAAGDSLGQVSGSDGDSAVGSDGENADGEGGSEDEGEGSGEGSDAPKVDLQALSAQALAGGGSVAAAKASEVPGGEKLTANEGAAGIVLFAEGSAQIDAAGQEVIAATAKSLKDAGVTSVDVVGHTDRIAGDPVNDTLSKERSENVAAALKQALPGVEVTTAAKGQDEPIASNEDEAGRQLNRRAVITARG